MNLTANLDSPAFTGTITGITKAMVGLENVDNTTDLSKPISSATQTALNLKSNLNNPTFTGILTAPTVNATTQLQVNGVDIKSLYQEKPWVAGQVTSTGGISVQSGRNTFTITKGSTGYYTIGFPNIGSNSYTPFIQLRTSAGFSMFQGASSTSVQFLLYNTSNQLMDQNFAFFIYRTF